MDGDRTTATLGRDIGEAVRIATSGRPGPVHVSLPSDLLDARVDESAVGWPERKAPCAHAARRGRGRQRSLAAIAGAKRPLIIAGPQLSNVAGRALLARLEAATGAPAVIMESPRGIADATLGAFPDLIKRADLIVLLGKALDFTTKWATGPAFDPDVRVIAIDPDEALVARAGKEKGERLLIGVVADANAAAEALASRGKNAHPRPGSPRRAPRSTAGRWNGARWSRKRRDGCIRPRCSARCGPMSSAIPTRC